ncbi:MAG: CbtB domain-containing protein [Alphaproteobacteria bacterium]
MTTLTGGRTAISSRQITGLVAIMFGMLLFIAAGFASPSAIHNATHDVRHSLGLPCH